NIPELLERAVEMEHSCADSVPVETNPGVWLGAVMGRLATQGRNKVTLITSPRVATFGYWVEQLLAESTGKEGKGLVPIEGEPIGTPAVYGDDLARARRARGSCPSRASPSARRPCTATTGCSSISAWTRTRPTARSGRSRSPGT